MHIFEWDNRRMAAITIARNLFCFAFLSLSLANHTASFNATFIFGDSLLDTGNNNYFLTLSRANYYPNGIDFGKSTGRFTNSSGRFTNGRTLGDIIGQEIGLQNFTPPYLAPETFGPVILKGVNYASGASGILEETGKIFIGRINMNQQIDNFEKTRHQIIKMIGLHATKRLFNNSLFQVAMGSNDFINNYLLFGDGDDDGKPPSPDRFVGHMITRYRLQLTRLYNLGARNIIVADVGAIGCIPFLKDVNLRTVGDSCADMPNKLAQMFNFKLKSVLTKLNKEFGETAFLYADTYSIIADIVENYTSYGFESANACCSTAGKHGGLIPCFPLSKLCPDRSKYVFWDAYHPSDATNAAIAKRLLNGGTKDISPMNIMQLSRKITFR